MLIQIPAKTCPRCLGDGKQQPQNCGVCVQCHGVGDVPAHERTPIVLLADVSASNWVRRTPREYVPDLWSSRFARAKNMFLGDGLSEVA